MDSDTKQAVRDAFLAGSLKVEAVDLVSHEVALYPVSDVLQHHTGHKKMVRLTLIDGRTGDFTEDHSIFTMFDGKICPAKTGDVRSCDRIVVIGPDGRVSTAGVAFVKEIPPEELTYDLSVPGPENFRLTNGILAHNSYTIGGVSLDIEKSSKYQSMMDAANVQFDKATESKTRTVKFIRGLQQPRFGIGVRSAFGPYTGRGVLSPRNFV